jgi:hypothetical protein
MLAGNSRRVLEQTGEISFFKIDSIEKGTALVRILNDIFKMLLILEKINLIKHSKVAINLR